MLPTPLFIIYPYRYLEPIDPFDPLELEAEWEYEQDPWNGWLDHAQHPHDTLLNASGDCVDYARLAASHLYHNTDNEIALYITTSENAIGHLVVADDESIWSTGRRLYTDPRTYGECTNRQFMIRRNIRDSTHHPFIDVSDSTMD